MLFGPYCQWGICILHQTMPEMGVWGRRVKLHLGLKSLPMCLRPFPCLKNVQLSFQEEAIFLVREKVAGGTSIKEMSSCNEQRRTGRRPRCIRQSITKKMEGWKAINSASAQPGWDDEGPKSGPLLFPAKASEAGIAQRRRREGRDPHQKFMIRVPCCT